MYTGRHHPFGPPFSPESGVGADTLSILVSGVKSPCPGSSGSLPTSQRCVQGTSFPVGECWCTGLITTVGVDGNSSPVGARCWVHPAYDAALTSSPPPLCSQTHTIKGSDGIVSYSLTGLLTFNYRVPRPPTFRF